MYPLYFYICLLASTALVIALVLLAIYPINFPIVETHHPKVKIPARSRPRKARSPTSRRTVSYWDTWDDDEEDL